MRAHGVSKSLTHSVALEQAPDLTLQAAHVQRPAGMLQAPLQPGQALFDPSREALVHRALFLAPFHGANEHEGLHPVGPHTLLGLDAVAHRLPVPRVGNRARPFPQFTLWGSRRDTAGPSRGATGDCPRSSFPRPWT